MIDFVVKVLLIMFSLAVGGWFALWPEDVNQSFQRWREGNVKSSEGRAASIQKRAEVLSIRPIGLMLVGLTGYLIYLWISTE